MFEGLSESEINEVVEYGIWRGKIIVISAFLVIALSAIMGILTKGIIFLICMCSLRRYAGGYHADTQSRCYVISFIVLILSLLWMKSVDNIGMNGITIQLFMLLILVFLAPVENKNRILDEAEKKKYGKKTRTTAIFLSLVYILMCELNKPEYAIPIETAFVVLTISLIVGFVKNRKNCETL